MHNGDVSVHLNVNGTSGSIDCELEQSTDVAVTIETTQATTAPAAVNDVMEQTLETDNDSHLAAVLRQETPVDDDDDQLANNDGNTDTNGINASSTAVTTIAVRKQHIRKYVYEQLISRRGVPLYYSMVQRME